MRCQYQKQLQVAFCELGITLWFYGSSDSPHTGARSLLFQYSKFSDSFGVRNVRSAAKFTGKHAPVFIYKREYRDAIWVFFFKEVESACLYRLLVRHLLLFLL